jgi:hypothetical protein
MRVRVYPCGVTMVAFGLGGSPSCTGSQMADAQPRLAARNAPGTFWPVREAGGSARLGADPHADAAERAITDGAVTTEEELTALRRRIAEAI